MRKPRCYYEQWKQKVSDFSFFQMGLAGDKTEYLIALYQLSLRRRQIARGLRLRHGLCPDLPFLEY